MQKMCNILHLTPCHKSDVTESGLFFGFFSLLGCRPVILRMVEGISEVPAGAHEDCTIGGNPGLFRWKFALHARGMMLRTSA